MAEAMINAKYAGSQGIKSSLCHSISEGDQDCDEWRDKSRPASTKVVDFDLPAKRIKPSASITAQTVIQAIQDSITKKDRLDAIYTACATYDHDIQDVHDEEIAASSDIALCKHLSFLLLKRQNVAIVSNHVRRNSILEGSLVSPFSTDDDVDDIVKEIRDTIRAIEMIFRCSASMIAIAFNRIGSELLPLLINEIQEELGMGVNSLAILGVHHKPRDEASETSSSREAICRISSDSEDDCTASIDNQITAVTVTHRQHHQRTNHNHLKTCTKIIAHFARVGSLTEPLAKSKGLFSTLQYIISSPEDAEIVPLEAKLNSLWILGNLACNAENMIMMARNPDLINMLVEIISHPNKDDEENAEGVMQYLELLKCRSVGLRAILNLSWANENKALLSEDLRLVETLLSTARQRSSKWGGHGKGVSGVLLQSRRHAAGALRNLAAAERRTKRHLCRLRSGRFLDEISDIAKDADSDVRDKVHATFWNLVSADTAKLYTQKKDVLDIIAREAMATGSIEERNNSAQVMAARTLRSLEKTIPEDEEGYQVLKPILCQFESTLDSDSSSVSEVSSMRLEAV